NSLDGGPPLNSLQPDPPPMVEIQGNFAVPTTVATDLTRRGRVPVWRQGTSPLYASPPSPLQRPRISEVLDVGVRSINALLTLGKGQRMGIMAGSGVGKSTLMGMMARYTAADVNVIGLIGERGREVLEFIEKDLGTEGMARSVVIVATSDQSPLVRMRAAYAATAAAEYFRDHGLDVLLMMDSITRFAMAAREVGLAVGEPPTTKGYTPTVFAQLPKLLERAGRSDRGTITGIYTVLVDGDDFNEPIADAARSILDGHIVLTRELADQGHFPAIDVLRSISRLRADICSQQSIRNGQTLLRHLAAYRKVEDMINIGAYAQGSSQDIDRAIVMTPRINEFLRQDVAENQPFAVCEEKMAALAQQG
ncbi:MAG: FliI/YscN family ATPase, partial [Desulfovibrionaceae bacterium]|nr:FliI/YscN family ATPase [Desulfovibrionaceae bacterium]